MKQKLLNTQQLLIHFLQKSVGVADHDDFIKVLKSRFDKLVHAKHAISELDIISKKVPIVEETNKTKKEK